MDFGLYPYVIWLGIFIFAPLILVLTVSFQEKGLWGGVSWVWSWGNYIRALDPIYLSVLWSSLKLAGTTALACLILGFPMAWYMTKIPPRLRSFALVIVLMPFISNFVVRAYALKFLIGVEGPLNRLLMALGWIQAPLFMEDVRAAVLFGMLTNYLPFMILPLYVALEKFDFGLIESAQDLGANSRQVFFDVVLPMMQPAVLTGVTLVFVPALGELVIPDLLGGGKTMYIGNLLSEQFLKARDWPFGASLCVLMMLVIGLFSMLFRRRASS
jgi:spermidine/putrescine transport system permease protein